MSEKEAVRNTDRELWRERPGDYYADSIHVTVDGSIGIDCGGTVFVMPVRKWHALAALAQTNDAGRGEPKIYTKADAEALCAIAVAAATSGTYESNCERIEKRLMEHRLSYTHGDDGDAYPLVDRLTPDGEKSIETGRKEIELLAENIADLFGKPEPPAGAAVRAAALEEAAKK